MVPIGMSCGGMFAVKYAALFPETVACLYLDAPVMNLLSCPAGLGRAGNGMFDEYVNATNMTMSKLICYREHPIDKIDILGSNRIPVIMVYGTDDNTVPYEENGGILEEYYNRNHLIIKVIKKEHCGHHPHGLEDPTEIAACIEKFTIYR